MLTKCDKIYQPHGEIVQEHHFSRIEKTMSEALGYRGGEGQASQIHPPGEVWDNSNLHPQASQGGGSYYGMQSKR